jgi:hypothetical protein
VCDDCFKELADAQWRKPPAKRQLEPSALATPTDRLVFRFVGGLMAVLPVGWRG